MLGPNKFPTIPSSRKIQNIWIENDMDFWKALQTTFCAGLKRSFCLLTVYTTQGKSGKFNSSNFLKTLPCSWHPLCLNLVWKYGFHHRRFLSLAFAELLSSTLILWSDVSFSNSHWCIFNSDLFPALDDMPSERPNSFPLFSGVCHQQKIAFKTLKM